ncbi:MAG: DNA polymerase III subunit gamma/tau [Alphaproteobacteria bacterium]|nr:MAG: DNA polymerase III subunit gamma/tau [Alphaproteobacteria bacterium]
MNYKVLARKYRPQNFQELIGQDILVNTLKNALNDGRLAHAFLLTGIRGIGKTTTARIIAKAFNCEGNNNNKPTFEICNNCGPCNAITKGNSLDVIEIDAASKTGVDNIREIIESVMYSTNEMRFKIYIIDEVHMLSTAAFNALLKTLEEPPNNTKFIFATTETKKIPATIISRCQRFDLKRIDDEVLINHLKSICVKEDITIDDESLKQISSSSEGSMRDALSILDQVAALSNNQIQITELRQLLGIRSKLDFIKLYKFCLDAKASEALNYYYQLIQDSTDPSDILNSLISICSDACKFVVNNNLLDEHVNEFKKISEHGITKLLRSWQVLIKGLDETKSGTNQIEIVSIIIVKLCYTSSTPMPEELIKKLDKKISNNSTNQTSTKTIENKNIDQKITTSEPLESDKTYQPIKNENKVDSEHKTNIENKISLNNFEELLTFLIENREALLHAQLVNNVVIDSFESGKISMKISENCSFDVVKHLSKFLQDKTGLKWVIEEVQKTDNKTHEETKDINFEKKKKEIESDPIINEVKQLFPNAEIKDIE